MTNPFEGTDWTALAKVDKLAVDGLSGTEDSLAYKVHEIEKHHHNSEYWFGDGGSNTLADNLTEIQVTAGTSEAYGTELLIHSGADLSIGAKIDLHEILVTAVSATSKVYKVKFHYGTGAFGASTFLTEVAGYFPASTGKSSPIPLITPRIAYSNKIWAVSKCETNSATLDFLVGIHGYVA